MSEIVWISIRDGEIVGTPFGPDIPNGKYMIVEELDSEGGGTPSVVECLCQYQNDLRYPPDPESICRRLSFVENVLRKMLRASTNEQNTAAVLPRLRQAGGLTPP